jgi:hypothetical protein
MRSNLICADGLDEFWQEIQSLNAGKFGSMVFTVSRNAFTAKRLHNKVESRSDAVV